MLRRIIFEEQSVPEALEAQSIPERREIPQHFYGMSVHAERGMNEASYAVK